MLAYAFALLERVKADRKGVTALEYGVLAGVVVAAVATGAALLSTNLGLVFTRVAGSL